MKIEYVWILENQIIFANLTGKIELSELADAMKYLLDLLNSGKIERLHLVYNMQGLEPAGRVGEVVNITRDLLKHPRLGWIVNYGLDNQVTEFVYRLVIKITNSRVEFVENHESALNFLKTVDKTIEIIPS
jgi:hypothetical protein